MSTPESTRYPCNPWELDSKEPRAKIAKHYEATIHTAYRGETIKHITGHTILLFHELYEHCLDSKETVYTQLDCPIDSSATNQGDPRMVTVTQNQHTRWSSVRKSCRKMRTLSGVRIPMAPFASHSRANSSGLQLRCWTRSRNRKVDLTRDRIKSTSGLVESKREAFRVNHNWWRITPNIAE